MLVMSKQALSENENPTPDQAASAGLLIAVELAFDPDTNVLSAELIDADTPLAVDLSYLQDLIAHHEFQDLHFEKDALQQLLSRIEAGERGSFTLGERRDAKLTINISDDAMRVIANTEPAYGGTPLSIAQVESALTEAKVDPKRWNRGALQKLVTEDSVVEYEIASGVRPEAGTNSKFVQLVEGIVTHAPTEEENGNVNQYEVNDFLVVEPGTPLMRREPVSPGVDGIDVHGTTLPATTGKHTSYAKKMAGVIRDEKDSNLLIAATKGHPVALANGVYLDEVLKLPSADMRTGHVHFDGSICITGDVTAGVHLTATGDVTVKGTVEHATIQAGANIFIGGGAVNPDPQLDEDQPTIKLEAVGNIQAKFVSGAYLNAKGNVLVKEYIGFCHTEADDQVRVGQDGGKGRVYGGSCHGRRGVLANQLGSNSSVLTIISAGLSASPSEDQSELNDEVAVLEEQCKKVQLLLNKMHCNLPPTTLPDDAPTQKSPEPPDDESCNKLRNTLDALETQQAVLRRSLADLEIQRGVDGSAEASVFASKSIRAGVTLRINGVQRKFKSRDAGGTFKLQEGAIVRVE